MQRIHWTREEESKVILALQNVARFSPWLSCAKAFEKAQEVLPQEWRKKKTAFYGETRFYSAAWEQARNNAEAAKVTENGSGVKTQDAGSKTQTAIENLAQAILQDIHPILEKRVRELLLEAVGKLQISPDEPKEKEHLPAVKEKKRILVIGLLGSQETEVSNKYGNLFKLTFFKSDDNLKLLEARVLASDKAVLVTNFISHSHQTIVRRVGNNKLRYATGGMSTVFRILDGILEEEAK